MKWVRRRGGKIAAVLLAVCSSAACTDEQTGFFIRGNVKLDAPECLARAEGSATLLLSGLLDVALKRDYEATLLVGSQLAPRGDKANLRTETMITTITGAEVHLYDDVGAPVKTFTVPATGVIPPDSSDDAGFGIVTATLVPADVTGAYADEFTSRGARATLVADVTVFGRTIGGLDVESSPFNYVIQVCEGCIVDFPAEAILDPADGCFASSESTALVAPCNVGQDEAVDCRICSGTNNPYCVFPGGTPP